MPHFRNVYYSVQFHSATAGQKIMHAADLNIDSQIIFEWALINVVQPNATHC